MGLGHLFISSYMGADSNGLESESSKMDAAPPRQRPRLPLPGAAADVLESLPSELLNAILSRLPLRDAVRTSALARAWRRRWQSVPSLKFKWDESANPGAVTGVLRRYSYPVEDDNILEGLSCPFNDLKRLTLDTSLSLLSSVLSGFCLLRNAPKLEDLYIEVNDVYSERDEVEIDFLNAQWTGDLLSKLIRVDVVDAMCMLSEMNFIKLYCPRQDGLKNSMSVLLKTVQNPMKWLQSW
ncbi:hypothetical protein C2845_PM12G15020 [Panicum miliaceum]|uniref:F-box domain-containing protein n=1 Tax=Panicum miliaceum TaxID=4540 RepID=A0A3L6QFQ0_PANMI|nr:hypothetical protein C2845_PM12G15020 [Panicum miliaceum]